MVFFFFFSLVWSVGNRTGDLFNVLRKSLGANLESYVFERVTPISGDICDVNLGIKDSILREEMWNEIDIVLNSAATTNFDER